MKDETQSLQLTDMVVKRKLYPEYELFLPSILVKNSSLKKLSKGDIFLLGDNCLNIKLVKDENFFANLKIEQHETKLSVEILTIEKYAPLVNDSKKYETIKLSFGFLQSRVFEVGYKINIASIDLGKVDLMIKNKTIAKGKLVSVDEEIAVEVTKVNV